MQTPKMITAEKLKNAIIAYDEAYQEVNDAIKELPKVGASKLGLDSRCGMCHIDEEAEAIYISRSFLGGFNYFGGFQYIQSEPGYYGKYLRYDSSQDERIAQEILTDSPQLSAGRPVPAVVNGAFLTKNRSVK